MFPRERLVKLLMMTTSDKDGEALVAVRKANKLLRQLGVNWQELLALPLIEDEPEPKPPPPSNDKHGGRQSAFVRRP